MTKRTTMAEAIERWVPDGSSVVMGACLDGLVPFAAGHEMIRQERRGLTLVAPASDMLFDLLMGAGCATMVMAAWVGNASAGPGHCFRRVVEQGIPHAVEVRDHSTFSLALALLTGGLGSPFIPTQSLLGSDLPNTNPDLIESVNPLNERGDPIILVRALQPDVAILHVQRADEQGNAHLLGPLGVSVEAALASQVVIIVAEEIVSTEMLLSDPNRVLAPAHKVVAVVEEPGGAHPSPVPGYYRRDHRFFNDYHEQSRTVDGFAAWLEAWVMDVEDRRTYLERLGRARWQGLRAERAAAAPTDYGS